MGEFLQARLIPLIYFSTTFSRGSLDSQLSLLGPGLCGIGAWASIWPQSEPEKFHVFGIVVAVGHPLQNNKDMAVFILTLKKMTF